MVDSNASPDQDTVMFNTKFKKAQTTKYTLHFRKKLNQSTSVSANMILMLSCELLKKLEISCPVVMKVKIFNDSFQSMLNKTNMLHTVTKEKLLELKQNG